MIRVIAHHARPELRFVPLFSSQLPRNKAREELISRLLLLKTTTCPSCILIDPTCRYYFASVPLIKDESKAEEARMLAFRGEQAWQAAAEEAALAELAAKAATKKKAKEAAATGGSGEAATAVKPEVKDPAARGGEQEI